MFLHRRRRRSQSMIQPVLMPRERLRFALSDSSHGLLLCTQARVGDPQMLQTRPKLGVCAPREVVGLLNSSAASGTCSWRGCSCRCGPYLARPVPSAEAEMEMSFQSDDGSAVQEFHEDCGWLLRVHVAGSYQIQNSGCGEFAFARKIPQLGARPDSVIDGNLGTLPYQLTLWS